ncbi:MAG: ATP-dependent Clp protease proteolytic subunit, partial [Planctomycetia bacterium]
GILLKHSGRSMEEIDRDTDRDKFMAAEEALSYGLIDKVVEDLDAAILPKRKASFGK